MNKIFSAITLTCLFLLLAGCREDAQISRTDIQFLQQGILVTTSSNEDFYTRHTEQLDTLYINQGERVIFTAGYALNGNSIPSDSALNLYAYHFWELEGDSINATSFEHTFDSVGYRIGILNTIDYTGDTLKDTIHIFVGTPLNITLVAPAPDMSIDPLADDYVELNWDISGIDPWEKSFCAAFAVVAEGVTMSQNTKWLDILDSLDDLSENDCKTGMRLKGPLISPQWLQKYGIDPKDSSLTVYWGVKAYASTDYGFEEHTSDVSSFNTLFIGKKNSVIQIKPIYEGITAGTEISAKIVLVSALGDTIKTVAYKKVNEPQNIVVSPQSGLHIYAYETLLNDYEAKPLVIDVPESSKIRLGDSIVFTDKIPPKASPVKNALALTDSIKFYFMDNGSGISPSQKTFVIADFDTVYAAYESPVLSFANPCRKECEIRIPIPDNVRNRNSEVFWKLTPGRDSLLITGPFVQMEDLEYK